jgi:hypothetical protein
MNKKGKIVDINENKVKVIYEEINIMTPFIDVASHISVASLAINKNVIVAIYDNNLRTGAVIGVIE